MKLLISILLALIQSSSSGQEIQKVFLTKNGFIPNSIVVSVDSINSNTIYERTLNWIKKTYAYPDKIIITRIENSMIRIKGNQIVFIHTNELRDSFNIKLVYTLEINIKNGKYKLDFSNFKSSRNSHEAVFKRKGQIAKNIRIGLENSINSLIASLNSAILNKVNDW